MIFALEFWYLIFQVGLTRHLDSWMIQADSADYQPLISLQLATSYFEEDHERVTFLQFICGPLMVSIGWVSYFELADEGDE